MWQIQEMVSGPRPEEVKKKIGDAMRGRSWIINPETGKRMWVDK